MIIVAAALLLGPQVWTADADKNPAFALVPIETALQRRLLGVDESSAPTASKPYLLWIRLDKEAEDALPELIAEAEVALNDISMSQASPIELNLEVGEVDRAIVDRVDAEIGGVLRRVGLNFLGSRHSYSSQSADWSEKRARLLAETDEKAAKLEDPNFGDRGVRMHEVHTSLGRVLLDGADLWVSLRGPLSSADGWLEPSVVDDIRVRINDRTISLGKLSWNVEHWYGENGDWDALRGELDTAAISLGFKSSTLSTSSRESPRAGEMVGKIAPDFELERLTPREPMRFREVTAGKVVLLSFWGVG